MQSINEIYTRDKAYPEKIIQFGEGNFLRAFFDDLVDRANRQGVMNAGIVICQPRSDSKVDLFNSQDCLYTLMTRGIENGEQVDRSRIIDCVTRCISPYRDYMELLDLAKNEDINVIVSNTTEAGIAFNGNDEPVDMPPSSFPAKLTAFLYARFKAVLGNAEKGFLIIPTELIENNGAKLKEIVLMYAKKWELKEEFIPWVEQSCCFANTLVDRVVAGYPREDLLSVEQILGYEDKLIDVCEPFMQFFIECDERFRDRIPFENLGPDVRFVDDLTPYRLRKLRMLNGAHTACVLAAFLQGYETLYEMMCDEKYRVFLKKLFENEIIPFMDMEPYDLTPFASAVLDRFSNPFIKHRLSDISPNSVSKFRVRDLPSLISYYEANGVAPTCLCFSLAALIRFFKGVWNDTKYIGTVGQREYEIRDSVEILVDVSRAFDSDDVIREILSNTSIWGMDLTQIYGLYDKVSALYDEISEFGVARTLENLIG
jgi:tagaturonate reductase